MNFLWLDWSFMGATDKALKVVPVEVALDWAHGGCSYKLSR